MRTILIAAVVLMGAGHAAADGSSSSPIVTDRPAVTDSSIVVPQGSLQFESGFADTASGGLRSPDGSETLVRFGLASKTELRLIAPDYFGQSGAGSGFGDLAIGMKQQLGPTAGGFDVSLILSLNLPSGARAIANRSYDPSFQLPWSRALSRNWTAAGMISVYWSTQQSNRDVTGETTFLIDRQLTKTWDAFVEYAGDFPRSGGPRHLIHFGTAYKPTPHQQLDFHVGEGMSSAAVDHFFGVGYSFRFQVIHVSKDVVTAP
jgi:Putative MetA-pathway of phenol degradation